MILWKLPFPGGLEIYFEVEIEPTHQPILYAKMCFIAITCHFLISSLSSLLCFFLSSLSAKSQKLFLELIVGYLLFGHRLKMKISHAPPKNQLFSAH